MNFSESTFVVELSGFAYKAVRWPPRRNAYVFLGKNFVINPTIKKWKTFLPNLKYKLRINTHTWPKKRILERLRYPGSGLRVRLSPFCLPTFADVSTFTRNFYPFPRGKPWSTRKRQTGTGVFCLLFVGRLNSKNFQQSHSTAKVTIFWSVFLRRSILHFLSYTLFPDLRVRVRVYYPYP
jgi:hypothetical protein